MIKICLAWAALSLAAAADTSVGTLFEEAEALSRKNQNAEALAKVEQAVAALQRAKAAGEKIDWKGMDGLRWAAHLAREDLLDYERSLHFCALLFQYADTDYWRVPARLERALTYRAMGQFEKAQGEYEAIAKADERQRVRMLVPRAEMVLFELGDEQQGRKLLEESLMCEAVNARERYNVLRNCAQRSMGKGRRDEAIAWYALLEDMPFGKADERARFLSQAWYEMGKIEESRGRTEQAKKLYRGVMELEDGEMRYRARARDALEDIEYFE
jgi:tetratricopeptide (TPR) repeat protein